MDEYSVLLRRVQKSRKGHPDFDSHFASYCQMRKKEELDEKKKKRKGKTVALSVRGEDDETDELLDSL